jgi:uncharacterized membrane protein YesL
MQMPSLVPEPGSWLDRIMTVILANVLWFVFAVPVITLPAATAGLFATLAPLVRNRDTELFATFFGAMRRLWLKSAIIFAADVALGVVIAINFQILNVMDPPSLIFWLFRSIYVFLVLAALMTNLYLWPLLVMLDLPLRPLVTVAAKLALTHPLWSLLTLGLALSPLVLAVFVPLALSVVIVFSITGLIVNWSAWRVIREHVTPEELARISRS